jgi:hypothetical protein
MLRDTSDAFSEMFLTGRDSSNLCGLFCGGILFLLLVYSFSYAYDLAGYIAIGWTVLSCIALASSVHARCIAVLMIPSLFTGLAELRSLLLV